MRIRITGNHYRVIEHRRLIPAATPDLAATSAEFVAMQTQVYALTLINERRQELKRLKLTGRQKRKMRKALARATKDGTLVSTALVDDHQTEPT